jgi:hypothetical protein
LSESKIQIKGRFAPCGLGSPSETLKDIKTRKLSSSKFTN